MYRSSLIHAITVVACLASGMAQARPLINKTLFGALAIDGYDAVAYQTDHRALKGKPEYSYRWQDANWRFASAAHLESFKAEPQRYAPQYGGYCAYAIGAKNELVDIDPEAFSVVDDKLYLNYSKDIRTKWDADRAHLIEAADRNWPALNRQ